MSNKTNSTNFKAQITGGLVYDELMQMCETWTMPEIYAAVLAFQQQNLGSLGVDDLEDMKTFLFNLIEDIDSHIEMSESRPSITRE